MSFSSATSMVAIGLASAILSVPVTPALPLTVTSTGPLKSGARSTLKSSSILAHRKNLQPSQGQLQELLLSPVILE